MRHAQTDPGCLYDTMAFLAAHLEEIVSGNAAEPYNGNPYYRSLQVGLAETNTTIPHYLYPFTCSHKERRPFLSALLVNDRSYHDCTYEKTLAILRNKQYLRRRFAEHFFDSADVRTVFRKITEHPAGIDLIKRQCFDPAIEAYIYHILLRFDDVVGELRSAFRNLYAAVRTEHEKFLKKTPAFVDSFQSDSTKLRALAKLQNGALRFSLTLMDATKIDFDSLDPGLFILGYQYDRELNTRYQHINTNPYAFALAIGSPVRYEIYRALLETSFMTRAELEKKLHLSRSAIEHNLRVMREQGLLILDHQTGITNYYRLDREYIRVAAGIMLDGAKG